MRVACRRTASLADAEDVVSEAMLRAFERGSGVENERAWLIRVVLNLCADQHRAAIGCAARRAYWASMALPVASHEDDVCVRLDMHGHLASLPQRQRQAVVLRAMGCDVNGIASHLDASYKTVESLLSRARRSLRSAVTVASRV